MNDFWNGKSLEMVTKDYLCSALDNLNGLQPMNADGIVKHLCENITIKNNARGFVADYFDDAVAAIRFYKPDSSYRLSQYEKTVNMMISKTAKDLLERCDTVKQYEGSYHIWKREDIENLKDDLEDLPLSKEFQRAADVKFESLESCAYRFLEYVLPGLKGQTVKLADLAMELPLIKVSDSDARKFIKGNFEESMRLLDDFRDSGYKANYALPQEMIQSILFQQQKEILAENPFLIDLTLYDGIETARVDQDFLDSMADSLDSQQHNMRLSKFEEMTQNFVKNFVPKTDGKVVDLKKRPNRVEIIY